jgi:hypothetical protein
MEKTSNEGKNGAKRLSLAYFYFLFFLPLLVFERCEMRKIRRAAERDFERSRESRKRKGWTEGKAALGLLTWNLYPDLKNLCI